MTSSSLAAVIAVVLLSCSPGLPQRDPPDVIDAAPPSRSPAPAAQAQDPKCASPAVVECQPSAVAFSWTPSTRPRERLSSVEGGALGEAAKLHLEAVGFRGVRGTLDPETMDRVARLYERALSSTRWKDRRGLIRHAVADLLYARKDWRGCARAFDEAADELSGADAAHAHDGATLCYLNTYAIIHRDGDHRKPIVEHPRPGLTEIGKGMVRAFSRHMCRYAVDESDPDAIHSRVEMKFALARTYFDAHMWAQAARGFRDIAQSHPGEDAAPFAAELYAESAARITSSAPCRTAFACDRAPNSPQARTPGAATHCNASR